MSIHLSTENLERYRSRTLPPRDLLAADDHLAACESCRKLTARAPAGEKAFAAFSADLRAAVVQLHLDHLAPEQMEAIVDNNLDVTDRAIVESHLAICTMCAGEIDDLRAFSVSTQHRKLTAASQVSPSFLDRLRNSPLWLALWAHPRLAATAAGLLLAVLVLLVVWKSTSAPRLEVAITPPGTPGSSPEVQSSPLPSPSVTVELKPAIIVSLNDGGQQVTLDDQGNVSGLGSITPFTQGELKAALLEGQVKTPSALGALIGKSAMLMGTSSEGLAFPLVGPVGTVVRTNRPGLRWRALHGAESYTVTLLDSKLNLVETSPTLTGTGWTVSAPLKRGEIYLWQVTALKDGKEVTTPVPPAPEARFKILDSEQLAELRRVETKHPKSHLARGLSYASAGLLEDAQREFRELLATNPESEVVRKLLQSLESARRAR